MLAYGTAILSGEYTISTATNGREALEKLHELRPAVVLLDLSMPDISGDEVLARVRADADPLLRATPIIIVSSEVARGDACLAAGADAFLPKPVRADTLKATVARVLGEADARRRSGNLQVLLAEVGNRRVALPLDQVRTVILQPATRPLGVGLSFLTDYIELADRGAAVLDMAVPLRVEHTLPLWERKLVVIEHETVLLALSFDRVLDPIEILPGQIIKREALVHDERMLGRAVQGAVMTAEGTVPVVHAAALFSRNALRRLGPEMAAMIDRSPA